MVRKATVIAALTTLLICSVRASAQVKFEWVWKSPQIESVHLNGQKVAALVVSRNRSFRVAAEQHLSNAISQYGVQGVAAHTFIPESEVTDRDKVRARLQESGISAIVVLRGTPKGQGSVDLDRLKDPRYQSFWGASGDEQEIQSSTGKDVDIYVETLIHSVDQDSLIWSGTSHTKTSNVDQFIYTVIDSVVQEMQKQGLVKKSE